MSAVGEFKTYRSLEDAEKRLRQETLAEHAVALNNHADAIEELNTHHATMHTAIKKLQDQMDCVLDGLTQINTHRDAIERRLACLEEITRLQSQRYDALITRIEKLENAHD